MKEQISWFIANFEVCFGVLFGAGFCISLMFDAEGSASVESLELGKMSETFLLMIFLSVAMAMTSGVRNSIYLQVTLLVLSWLFLLGFIGGFKSAPPIWEEVGHAFAIRTIIITSISWSIIMASAIAIKAYQSFYDTVSLRWIYRNSPNSIFESKILYTVNRYLSCSGLIKGCGVIIVARIYIA